VDGVDVTRRSPFGDNPLVGERGATTQRRILDAAVDVFGQHGYHDTRVELITKAAGCSRPAFYQYFASKDDVFWRLAAQMAKEMDRISRGLGTVTPDDAGVDQLRVWLDDVVDLCDTYAPILAAFQAAMREQARTAKGSRSVSERLGEAILRDLDRPGVARRPTASVTVSVVLRAIHYWRLGLGQVDRPRFLDGLARTLHRLLFGTIAGVNVGPVIKPPPKRAPSWPVSPPDHNATRPLRPRGQQTRERLLAAGSAVLPILGYHETRVDDIVEEAGISHGSFYRYFDSKDDLFQSLANVAATAMVELLNAFPEDPDEAAVRTWLREWFATYRANGGIISAWQEIGQTDPVLAGFSLEIATVAFDRLVRIVHRRGFGDSTVGAIVLLSVIERVPYNVLVLGYVAEDNGVEAAALIVRRGLLGLEPA
jgi:AcrR family transcriptional regulator